MVSTTKRYRREPFTQDEEDAAIKDIIAERDKLKEAIVKFTEGYYGEGNHKNEKCSHGLYGYETCENCITQHFLDALKLSDET